jgi:hypothetical protein
MTLEQQQGQISGYGFSNRFDEFTYRLAQCRKVWDQNLTGVD